MKLYSTVFITVLEERSNSNDLTFFFWLQIDLLISLVISLDHSSVLDYKMFVT